MAKKNTARQNTQKNPLTPAPTNHESLNHNPFSQLKLAGSDKKNKNQQEEIKPTFKSFNQERDNASQNNASQNKASGNKTSQNELSSGKKKKGFGYVGGNKTGVAHRLGKESQAIADDESDAFANAMGGVEAWTTDALGVRGPKSTKKAPKGTLKKGLADTKKQVTITEPVVEMSELDSFKALEHSLKAKKDNFGAQKGQQKMQQKTGLGLQENVDPAGTSGKSSAPVLIYGDAMAAKSDMNSKMHPKTPPQMHQDKFPYSAQQRSRMAVASQREQEALLFDENACENALEADFADEMTFANALENMKDVKPLNVRGRQLHPEVEPLPASHVAHDPVQDFLDGLIEFKLEFTAEYLEGHVVGLDPITIEKLRAGQYSPEAHLDLHGMNAEQAYEDLVRFFRRAYHQGLRTVLIIPGRGRNSPNGYGVLRERLQRWLTQDPFKRVVLAFCTAQLNDGGAGAVYVLLRKFKKSRGKIHWDRLPTDIDLF